MPMTSVQLRPGVNTQRTLSANEAGVSVSQMIRYKDQLIQTNGGFVNYVSFTLPSTIRDMHAWQGLQGTSYLGCGGTTSLDVITSGSDLQITPQTLKSDVAPNFSISTGNPFAVTVVDANSGPSIFNSVFFNTPISIGNLYLTGGYPITTVLSTGSYIITSSVAASTTITSSGKLPVFNATQGTPTINVTSPNNGYQQIVGQFYSYYAPTSISGQTIQGPYQITNVLLPSGVADSTTYTITLTQQATATATVTMNGGLAEFVYYIAGGPPPIGSGFGAGGFGSGGFGLGVVSTANVATGTPITATDWTLDNWGEILLACPKGGPVYTWSQDSGLQAAQVIPQAPFFNTGIFVSQPLQILVLLGSGQALSGTHDPLLVTWSDQLNYANYTVSNQTQAGFFHIPTGSVIIGGLQAPTFGVIWTDIDVWQMSFVGGTVVFNFTRVGSGCGLVGPHAANVLAGNVYWMSPSNFYMMSANGVQVLPCTVWDQVFQNINRANINKVKCAPNSAFNEIGWEYPSLNATECDSYVRFNIVENEWDYGLLGRSAWVDVSVLGNPIAADLNGNLWQHETGALITGVGLPSFQSGWWAIADGNELATVDWVLPDFIWGLRGGAQDAQVNLTFLVTDYPGDTPRSYGPFTVTQGTEYITPRFRGRLMSVVVSAVNSEFWRLGRIRYRYQTSGRR
jgi:hypothetical protein